MTELHILSGPDKGQSFDLRGDSTYVGRSPQNDIQMRDRAISRRHLKIFRKGNRYFIKDLGSENGTFVKSKKLSTGVEYEIKEGVPIVVGMSVICLGEGCLEHLMPFLDSIDLSEEISEDSGIFAQHKVMTTQKILELVYKVSEALAEKLSVDEIMENLLEYIFEFLKKIDRGVIILIDDETGGIAKVASKLRDPREAATVLYNQDVVERVIKKGEGLMVSDARTEEEEDLVDTLKLSKIESVMCVPLISGSRIRGVIYVDSLKEPYGFRKEDLSLFADLGRRAGLAIENSMLRSSLEEG